MVKRIVGKEQYFTDPLLAKKSVGFLDSIFPLQGFDLIVEPSAGDGGFLRLLPENKRVGVDIDPQPGMDELIESDFLSWSPGVAEGMRVLTVGNPPFGQRSALAFKFIHHASEFSEVIAFILPRSFKKYTFQNRMPDYFHLAGEFDCDEFYTPDGKVAKVKSVFQVWEKKAAKRDKLQLAVSHPDFEMKHAHLSRITDEELEKMRTEYPFTIPQVGANFLPRDSAEVTQGSHWFIKPLVAGVRERFEQADYSFLSGMNLAHTSLGKADIIRAYKNS